MVVVLKRYETWWQTAFWSDWTSKNDSKGLFAHEDCASNEHFSQEAATVEVLFSWNASGLLSYTWDDHKGILHAWCTTTAGQICHLVKTTHEPDYRSHAIIGTGSIRWLWFHLVRLEQLELLELELLLALNWAQKWLQLFHAGFPPTEACRTPKR